MELKFEINFQKHLAFASIVRNCDMHVLYSVVLGFYIYYLFSYILK